ncbi:MAG: hypothetical protein HKP62_06560 [Sulfurovum sp.]|nr:hypothetical protein [Sulfurovum sp.]NNJ45658.1 hypothetical protein [Sulfurovum sp.]
MKLTVRSTLVSGTELLPEPYATMAGNARAIHYKALQLLVVYKDEMTSKREGEFTVYENIPNTVDITKDDVGLLIALGSEIEEYPTYFEVVDKTLQVGTRTHLVNDIEVPLTWADIETPTQQYTEIAGKFYIGSQALTGGATDLPLSEVLSLGQPYLLVDEYKAILPVEEVI